MQGIRAGGEQLSTLCAVEEGQIWPLFRIAMKYIVSQGKLHAIA